MIKQILHIFLLLFIFALTGCGEQSNTGDDKIETGNQNNQTIAIQPDTTDETGNESESNASGWGSSVQPAMFVKEPLELSVFNDLMNDTQTFQRVRIIFDTMKYDPEFPFVLRSFHLQIGTTLTKDKTLSTVSQVECFLSLVSDFNDPNWSGYTARLDLNQIMPLLDFIQSEAEYFFTHEEFDGAELPVIDTNIHMCDTNMRFSVSLVYQSYVYYDEEVNMISKCVDEIEPETPLYDFLQLFETVYVPLIIQESENYWSEEDLVWEL